MHEGGVEKEDGAWRMSDMEGGLADEWEYVMYGKVSDYTTPPSIRSVATSDNKTNPPCANFAGVQIRRRQRGSSDGVRIVRWPVDGLVGPLPASEQPDRRRVRLLAHATAGLSMKV